MNFNWKKIALLVSFFIVIILLGYALYYFLLRPQTSPVTTPNQNLTNGGTLPPSGSNVNIPVSGNTGGALPGSGEPQTPTTPPPSQTANGGVTITNQLTDVPVHSVTMSDDGNNLLYYDRNSGLFYRLDQLGNATPLSNEVFYNASDVTWSPNKNSAIIEYPDGANITYDFVNKTQVTLPVHWKEFDFSPTGNQIVFKSMGESTDNRWLAIAKADGSSAQKIESLGDKDQTVYPLWSPNNQIIAMFSEDRSLSQQQLYFVGLYKENFKALTVSGRDFRAQWSPEGDKLLYSTYGTNNGFLPTLWIASAQPDTIGQNNKNLKLNTWAEKCSFYDNTTIYCAVPDALPEGAGIFPQQLDTTPSSIYKIDLTTGVSSMIATPQNNQTIDTLVVDKNQQYLYFTSKQDGRLYQIRLR